MSRFLVLGICVATLCICQFGCGSSADSTVIQPTEDFQMTPEEQKAQDDAQAAREAAQ